MKQYYKINKLRETKFFRELKKKKLATRLDPWEIWDKRLPYWFLKIYEIRFHFKNQAKKSFENLKFLRQSPFPFKNQAKQKFWKPYSFALNNHMDPISF